MDQLFEFAGYLVQLWRVVLCAIAGALIAVVLSALIPSLPSAALFGFVFAAASAGVVWQVRVVSAAELRAGSSQPTISKPVSFLALAFIGGLWGALVEVMIGTLPALALTAVAPWLLAPAFGALSKRSIGTGATAFAMSAAITGFLTPHAIALAFTAASA